MLCFLCSLAVVLKEKSNSKGEMEALPDVNRFFCPSSHSPDCAALVKLNQQEVTVLLAFLIIYKYGSAHRWVQHSI